MSQRRYNTVHDLAALRLHPDGSRVSTSSVQNVRPRGAKHVTQDARGNWIARDAGGLGRVKKRRRRKGKGKMRRDESVQDEEGAALDSAEGSATDEGEEAGSGLKGRESKKRRTFLGGFDYLNPESSKGSLQHLTDASYVQGSSANDGAASPSSPPLSVPSSDLLKAIHHFATQFYTERGQLLDAGRDARRAKQRRRLARLRALSAKESVGSGPRKTSANKDNGGGELGSQDADSVAHDKESRADADDHSGTDSESNSSETSYEPENMDEEQYAMIAEKAKTRRTRERERPRDMYKAFDGSTLMAIGMLVEGHIASMLQAQVPSDWVEPDDEDSTEENHNIKAKGGKRRKRQAGERLKKDDKFTITDAKAEEGSGQLDTHVERSGPAELDDNA